MKTTAVATALAAALAVNANPASSAADCCKRISSVLPSAYVGPSSAEYDQLTKARWSNTSILHPGCVATPKSAQHVSRLVQILNSGNCQFSVKSGGHNANPGANSIDNGVSIDLHYLNSTSLSKDRSYVTLGTGINWGQAYAVFEKENIGFTGGICQDVGVGGLAVGGGQSLFQASKGWVVDNIINYEVVLASGQIVNVNQKHLPDLFKALKGGSTNFGIVTKVDLAAFDLDQVWGGQLLLNLQGDEATRPDMIGNLTKNFVDWVAYNKEDLDSGVQIVSTYLAGGAVQIVDLALSNTANIERPKALQPFLSMPNQVGDTTRHTKISDISRETGEAVPKGYRYVTATVTIDNDLDTLRQIWEAGDAVYNAIPAKDQIQWLVSLVPQPTVQQSYSQKSGGNVLGLDDTKDDQIVLWLLSRWEDPKLDTMMVDARQKYVDAAINVAKKNDKYSEFLYANYAGSNQDPICGYGTENAKFLKSVAKKYDPSGVFQRLMPGGFKLNNAKCLSK